MPWSSSPSCDMMTFVNTDFMSCLNETYAEIPIKDTHFSYACARGRPKEAKWRKDPRTPTTRKMRSAPSRGRACPAGRPGRERTDGAPPPAAAPPAPRRT